MILRQVNRATRPSYMKAIIQKLLQVAKNGRGHVRIFTLAQARIAIPLLLTRRAYVSIATKRVFIESVSMPHASQGHSRKETLGTQSWTRSRGFRFAMGGVYLPTYLPTYFS